MLWRQSFLLCHNNQNAYIPFLVKSLSYSQINSFSKLCKSPLIHSSWVSKSGSTSFHNVLLISHSKKICLMDSLWAPQTTQSESDITPFSLNNNLISRIPWKSLHIKYLILEATFIVQSLLQTIILDSLLRCSLPRIFRAAWYADLIVNIPVTDSFYINLSGLLVLLKGIASTKFSSSSHNTFFTVLMSHYRLPTKNKVSTFKGVGSTNSDHCNLKFGGFLIHLSLQTSILFPSPTFQYDPCSMTILPSKRLLQR